MKRKLQLLYKALWMVVFMLKNTVCTLLFKTLLYVNDVEYGCKLRTLGAVPQLRISRKKSIVKFGNNITFNNYNDVSWHSKCSIWVRDGASLVIDNGTGFNGAMVYAAKSVKIGKNVKIGGGAKKFSTQIFTH